MNIEVEGAIDDLYLYDISGKILQKIEVKNRELFQINLANYARGVYFINYLDEKRQRAGGKIIFQ